MMLTAVIDAWCVRHGVGVFVREGPTNTGEASPRVPRKGDRIYWEGDARHRRREGTIAALYLEERGRGGAALEQVMDIVWDAPPPDEARPWGGLSRGLPASRLVEPGWGYVDVVVTMVDAVAEPFASSDPGSSRRPTLPPELGRPLPLQVALGRAIRRIRTAAGYSQDTLADACGMHRTFIGAIERGENNVSIGTLERIAHTLGIAVADLFAEAEQGPPST